MIFITGATGSIGKELCNLMAKGNIPARAMCRKQEQLEQFSKIGLEAVLANFDHPESLKKAIEGCTKLFLLTPPDQDHTAREKSIIDIAIEAGIQHIVRISTSDTNRSAKLPYARTHAEIDFYLRSKSVGWTIIRPTGFMQNFIESNRAIVKGRLPHCLSDGQISYIDLRDIASVSKVVLTEDTHHGATYYLTGPKSLTVTDVAAMLSDALGFDVNAVNISETEMRSALTHAHLSDWMIDSLIEQFKIGANGGEIDVTGEVKRLTRMEPRTFAEFAEDYKQQFISK